MSRWGLRKCYDGDGGMAGMVLWLVGSKSVLLALPLKDQYGVCP